MIEREEKVSGQFIWGAGKQFVMKLPQQDNEQRKLLVAAVEASDHIHMNSGFEKK